MPVTMVSKIHPRDMRLQYYFSALTIGKWATLQCPSIDNEQANTLLKQNIDLKTQQPHHTEKWTTKRPLL
jgi:hypothetical protein